MKRTFFAVLFVALSVCAGAQENQSRALLEDMNVEFMTRGYFLAGSKIKDEQALGGFAMSRNFPKPLDPDVGAPGGAVSLTARPDEEAVFARKYRGLKVVLANGTDEQVGFPASDSRLYIVQEALDAGGRWKPVEYVPSSWCGNSYHTVFLGPKEYWEFAAPRYVGGFKTRLRFRLDWQKSETEKLTIYSNEFDGSVNVKQFTVQQGHRPTGIMDPYNN